MTKLVHSLALVCLICITIISSVPVCLSVRPFPADSEVVASAVVDTTNDEVSHPTEAASSVDTTVTETRDEDMNVSPCYATVAESQIEGRSEAPDADDDLTLVEVDCRRMLADYDPPKSNTNPKKRGLLEVSTELGVSEATTEPSTYSTAL
ncbi:hypothetical protein MPTK1_8g06090 [Marchantia polymorpha subsp. ruderalis]|nr:hypothetical protein MARPO_0013s0181 [Marchantia polymorpha]BBN18858.1 hypothetical protein Mp_8g06090 [Marchantia polymorpha subsp. ruderalis]|eukprot:PTQ45987.1 hypothetical protein MARPO_0013s0181 [Marchantia polymorpha]